jgi:hypothetical protein
MSDIAVPVCTDGQGPLAAPNSRAFLSEDLVIDDLYQAYSERAFWYLLTNAPKAQVVVADLKNVAPLRRRSSDRSREQ